MTDHLSSFLAAMSAAGIGPTNSSEIIADDKRRRYHIAGDKPGSKNGSYQLKCEIDFAFGWFKDFKEGITHKWNAKSARKFTEAEKAEYKKKRDIERKKHERERRAAQEKAAAKAEWIWKKCLTEGTTDYLTRKHAALYGAKLYKTTVVVPVRLAKKLASLQFISESGAKMFLKDGALEGGYFAIATREEDKSIIVICEGFATGCSLREASGLPVIVAFNAGNLKPVAEVIKADYPASRIIIAADNDQWTFKPGKKPADVEPGKTPGDDPRWRTWREAGLLFNPGLEKAQAAAVAIGGAAVPVPDFPYNEPQKYTDFNDAYLHLGAEYVKDRILRATPIQPAEGDGEESASIGGSSHGLPVVPDDDSQPPEYMNELTPLEAYSDDARALVELYMGDEPEQQLEDWREQLFYDKHGKYPQPRSLNNARLFLEHDPVLSKLFCYDEFAHDKIVFRCPPWEDVKKFKPRSMNDTDYTYLACELEKRGIVQAPQNVAKIISAVIKNKALNPAKEFFESLVWDERPRLDKWLYHYCGAEFDNPDYVSQIGRKWMTAAVKRVFEPGAKFDHILVVEGPQDAGKSLMLKELATIRGTEYFDDTVRISDLGNPAVVPKLQGVLIVEIAEMSGFKKKDVDELKQAITTTNDRIVMKYHNEASSFPRQFVFAGTINPRDGYLHDPTGNRRFWPVRVGKKIDIGAIRRDKEQLWAEAVVLYRKGEKLYLEGVAKTNAQTAQQERNVQHPWFQDIEIATRSRNTIPVKEIWELVGMYDKAKRTRFASDDITQIMITLGFGQKRRRLDGERQYIWERKTESRELALEEEDEVLHG